MHSDDTYAYIADGKLRTLEKPKKKKKIHIQISNEVNSEIENMLENELYINDSHIRKALAKYNKEVKSLGKK